MSDGVNELNAEDDADCSTMKSVPLTARDQACRKSCHHGRLSFAGSKLPKVSANRGPQ